MRKCEDQKDIGNVEAWAEVVEDLLHLVPEDQRAEVLALASKNEAAKAKKREANGGLIVYYAADIDWKNSPGFRHLGAITRLKSLTVPVFVRDITNNHSPEDAAQILFVEHRHGPCLPT